ncbi:MAG TPA: hypothetical protein VFR37_05505 [Longimicrobium sp.]|nr:hypothetical protein [Longimicrobium sp.]
MSDLLSPAPRAAHLVTCALALVHQLAEAERKGRPCVVLDKELAAQLLQLLRDRPVLRDVSDAQQLANLRREFMEAHGLWPPVDDLSDVVFAAIGHGYYG